MCFKFSTVGLHKTSLVFPFKSANNSTFYQTIGIWTVAKLVDLWLWLRMVMFTNIYVPVFYITENESVLHNDIACNGH